ncbi:hypothetical protein DFA_00517 [Cavenderia fasciculata]|uniref:Bulb-type lectin domain-containing protein n=1 Tax=Cavenderia fasciculata TaxID=261658 RepID=F4PSB0_CACFS|nr:uncharacterized protein DFA_00517 [Cavenderia fasciculata]EGG20656.1 hypothetical protein DFA_00517 [Cavenderia fasciculata]|eukprot:XP_004358506.1 hypothetical protein DFA_00517 [Cavenderia fasciculata]
MSTKTSNQKEPINVSSTSKPTTKNIDDDQIKSLTHFGKEGNFFVFERCGSNIWTSETYNKGTGPYKIIQKADGNIILYDVGDEQPIWISESHKQVSLMNGHMVLEEY